MAKHGAVDGAVVASRGPPVGLECSQAGGKARTSETRSGQRLSSCFNCDVQKVVLWRCVIFDTLRVPLFAAAEGRTQDLRIMRPTRLPTAPPRHAKRPPLADHVPIPKAPRSGARPSKKHGFFLIWFLLLTSELSCSRHAIRVVFSSAQINIRLWESAQRPRGQATRNTQMQAR